MPAGRPDLLTETMHENAVDALKNKSSDAIAADLCGIDPSTMKRWEKRGMQHIEEGIESKYTKFCRDVKKARGERDIRLINVVEDAATEHWQAAMRLLEARRPKEFSRSAYELDKLEQMKKEIEELKAILLSQSSPQPESLVQQED